jgi:hypothetical protein
MIINKIKISIIIPYYKGESYYHLLLSSINKSLTACSQFNFNYELITIIDSIETLQESVMQIANSAFHDMTNVNIVIKKNTQNIGVAGSRNFAISIANGHFLHIIDQDDLVSIPFYSKIISLLDSYNFILVNGEIRYTNKKFNTHKLYYLKPKINIIGIIKDDYIRSPGQIVFSKNLCKELTFPEPKVFKGADDRFFWIGLFLNNKNFVKPFYVANPYYIANIHNKNYSADAENLRRSALENWKIIQSNLNLSDYNKLVNYDILRIKFLLNDPLTYLNKLKGSYLSLKYFIKPNKILRFLFKRI